MDIYKKALKIVKEQRLFELKDDSESSAHFWNEIKGGKESHLVKIHKGKNTFSCSCMFGTLNTKEGGQTALCSHVVASILAICYAKKEKEIYSPE